MEREPGRPHGGAGRRNRSGVELQELMDRGLVTVLRFAGKGILIGTEVAAVIGRVPIVAGGQIAGDLLGKLAKALHRIALGTIDLRRHLHQLGERGEDPGMLDERMIAACERRQLRIGHNEAHEPPQGLFSIRQSHRWRRRRRRECRERKYFVPGHVPMAGTQRSGVCRRPDPGRPSRRRPRSPNSLFQRRRRWASARGWSPRHRRHEQR
jgi:hypothetical protein